MAPRPRETGTDATAEGEVNRWRAAWRRLRANFWISLAMDSAALLAVLVGVHLWQTRDLPLGEPAPSTILSVLDGSGMRAAISPGEAGVVYFFAPWCGVCRQSIDNLDELVEGGSVSWATAIALDYESIESVEAFVAATELKVPVLLGESSTARDWGIRAFPTYFVVDRAGLLHSRSVGYSTRVGLETRSWFAR